MSNFHAVVIAGTDSSVGKTTWSLALMGFFQKKGFTLQPFKVGPDYIDPAFHHIACQPRRSRNLDRFFLSENYLKDCFEKHSQGASLALVEGVMGLFDGRGPRSDEGSTAEIAKLLGLPVFLVIDGSGLGRSAAALVKGYQTFDPALDLKGVLINRVGGEGHFKWLEEAIEGESGVPVLGWLPSELSVSIPERHLGLRSAPEEEGIVEKLDRLAGLLQGRFDEGRFLDLTRRALSPQTSQRNPVIPQCRIGVAYDRAFSFYYEDNFDLLREAGGQLVFFSPLSDTQLPEGLDALYFGGGFPELYVQTLSENELMKASIREFYEDGGLLYAECGGLIYLAETFRNRDSEEFPLVGLIPGKIRMTEKLQNFGYHEVECAVPTFLFGKGKKLRSHEFHHSVWEPGRDIEPLYCLQGCLDGFYDGRLLASYQHLHFGQDPALASTFVAAAQAVRKKTCPPLPKNLR